MRALYRCVERENSIQKRNSDEKGYAFRIEFHPNLILHWSSSVESISQEALEQKIIKFTIKRQKLKNLILFSRICWT